MGLREGRSTFGVQKRRSALKHDVRGSNATFGVQTRRSAFKRDVRRSKFENFKRLFTPRGWLRSASNFVKTRFKRFPMFHCLKSKNIVVKTFSMSFGVWAKNLNTISRFLKSWSIFKVSIRFSLKNYPMSPKVRVCTFLGEGVEG